MKDLLVFGHKTFKITVPDEAKITFGPWSPSTGEGKYQMSEKALNGTLRVYESKKTGAGILAGGLSAFLVFLTFLQYFLFLVLYLFSHACYSLSGML